MVEGERTRDSVQSRFELKGKLGSGAVGVVYHAHDRERGVDVALKRLRLPTGAHLYRFKREFRALADIVHPNLVMLYDLQAVDGEWFITMEYIDGVSFIDYVRPAREPATPLQPVALDDDATRPIAPGGAATTSPAHGELDVDRLRASLHQLVEAVAHLHTQGILHRDIKPSNVLVDRDGRVVLCDFGLVVNTGGLEADRTHADVFVGTPAYASPEQAKDRELSEASDWYSVGVMLYEALSGARPFSGDTEEMLLAKQTRAARPPPRCAPEAQPFVDLCMALLQRDPRSRPSPGDILKAVSGRPPRRAATPPARAAPFVGRRNQLAALHDALAASRDGKGSVAVFVGGSSGVGKTQLIEQFLVEARDNDEQTVVLTGRCYEREQVPYKALDGIVDTLSSHLVGPDGDSGWTGTLRDARSLGRVFPVLQRVEAIAAPEHELLEPVDAVESRRRAFGALRHLLRLIAAERPLIVFIDDLQWGDVDSAQFLNDLIYHPLSPALLLVCSYRAEDAQTSPLLRRMLAADAAGVPADVRRIELDALDADEAVALATQIMEAEGATAERRARDIAVEAQGNPFLIVELGRSTDSAVDPGSRSLDSLLERRVAQLDADERAFLTLLAVAARPLSVQLVGRAAQVDGPAALGARLRATRMLRARVIAGNEYVEPYHDRLREVAYALASEAERSRYHRALAEAIEADGAANVAHTLVEHWLAAGDRDRAAGYAEGAARYAETKYAFHRAAHYWELLLELTAPTGAQLQRVQTHLAEALGKCGRLAEAARAYLAAAEQVADEESRELRRCAMEQMLRSGKVEDALRIATPLSQELGLSIPKGQRRALLSAVAGKVALGIRGLGFTERAEADIPRRLLTRVDACWSLAASLGFDDPMVGLAMQAKHLRYARSAGDVRRFARALALELCYLSLQGSPDKALKLAPRVFELAERIRSPEALGQATTAMGVAAFVSGQWRQANEHLDKGREILLAKSSGGRWEGNLAIVLRMAALVNLGEMGTLTRLLPVLVREADEQGNRYAANALRAWRSNVAWLALDKPAEARRQLREGLVGEWSEQPNSRRYYEFVSSMRIELFEGDATRAWEWVEEAWPAIRGLMLQRFPNMAVETRFLRARAALARVVAGQQAPAMLAEARAMADKLERVRLAWGPACAHLIRGCVALMSEQPERANDHLIQATIAFEQVDMALLAAASRRLRGALIGGDEGDELTRESTAWMRSENIRNPDAMVRLYAPVLDTVV